MKTKNLLTLAIVGTLLFGITSATSSYIHYKTVDGTGTITICDPDSNGTKCITMKDKNEGAVSTGVGCDFDNYNICYDGWALEGFESYEQCYQTCLDEWGEDESDCVGYCTPNLQGYENITMCKEAMSELYIQCMHNHIGEYGNHYQWGNNNGFPIGCYNFECSDMVTNNSTKTFAVWDNSYNNYGYNGAITNFIKHLDYWEDGYHNGLRGGENDGTGNNWGYDFDNNVATNVTGRQGPCGEGYHVPSVGEWNKLLEYWAEYNKDIIAIYYYMGFLGLYDCVGNNYSCEDENGENVDCNSQDVHHFECMEGGGQTFGLNAQKDFYMPFAKSRNPDNAKLYFQNGYDDGAYWTSSPSSLLGENDVPFLGNARMSFGIYNKNVRGFGFSVRCFKNYALAFPIVETTDDENFTATVGNQTYTGLEEVMEVITNNIEEETMENKPVVGEVSVSFGENVSAKFNKLVQVNVPVSNNERVIVKVKHAGSDEYNFDGLTTNRNASCNDNGRVANNADKYNGEIINVVDGFATIYTCEASSFIALGVEDGGEPQVIVNIADFNEGRNTCTGDNYVFNNIVAGPTTVTGNLVKTFQCAFGEAGGKAVTLQLLGDLEDGNGNTISSGNVKIKNSTWAATPSNVQSGTTAITTYTPLNQIVTLFNKTAGVIGRAEGSGVDIEITVLGGTPDGTYNGTLVLTY